MLAASGLTAAAAPSSAGPVVGSGTLVVYTIPGGFDVCVEGEVLAPLVPGGGTWLLAITGIRVDDDGATWLVDPPPWTSNALRIARFCQSVYTFGFPYGEMRVNWSYAGAGGSVAVKSVGGGTWDPMTGLHPWFVNPTP